MRDVFRKIANKISAATGSAYAFILAICIIVVWGISGPAFGYSDTWQLVINTGTTIVTFLMVFLIQNTQNRDSKAMQLKLDELIRSTKSARDSFVDLEDITDKELALLDEEFKALHDKHHPSDQMHKLHDKIAKEKQRRTTITKAGETLNTILQTPANAIKGSASVISAASNTINPLKNKDESEDDKKTSKK